MEWFAGIDLDQDQKCVCFKGPHGEHCRLADWPCHRRNSQVSMAVFLSNFMKNSFHTVFIGFSLTTNDCFKNFPPVS